MEHSPHHQKIRLDRFGGTTKERNSTLTIYFDLEQRGLRGRCARKGFDAKLTSSLPIAWGLGAVTTWTSLQTAAYKAKWEQARKAIEEIKPLVSDPNVLLKANVTNVKGNIWEIEDGAKIRISIPEGAKSVIYTLGDETPEEALEKITIQESGEVALDLKDKGTGELQVFAVDGNGNTSRKVTYRIRHKQKQHQVIVEKEDLFGEKGSFKFPDSLASFVEVIRSLTDEAVERGAITEAAAEEVKNAIKTLK